MLNARKIDHPEISNIFVLPTMEEGGQYAAELIAGAVKSRPQARITFATGNTQIPVYENLAKLVQRGSVDFRDVKAFHLDEYYPCNSSEPWSFVGYLYKRLFNPIGLPDENIFVINGEAKDPEAEAARYEKLVTEHPIDLTILGIGPGGHIAFCEEGTPFESKTMLIDLCRETIRRDTVERKQKSPRQAITQGISTIISSKKIILNAFDAWHGEVMKNVLFAPISPDVPGTCLRTVGEKVTIVMDEEAAEKAFS
jgi:glucosamine-6-phosphate deaminase